MPSVLLTLLTAHARARLRRMVSAVSTARLMSLVVFLLAVAWAGQTVASVLFREPYDPEVFRIWVAVLLFVWTVWHCVRIAWQRPETAIEWSAEEEYLIAAGPFSPRELLVYRFTTLLTATLPKALLTIVVLLPDLSWYSPFGILLAVIGLEVFRLLLDIGTSCLSPRGYLGFRLAVAGFLAVLTASGFAQVWFPAESAVVFEAGGAAAGATPFVRMALQNEPIAMVAAPFFLLADTIAANQSAAAVGVRLAGGLGLLLLTLGLVERLESVWRRVTVHRERSAVAAETTRTRTAAAALQADIGRLPRIPFCGPLVWRQFRRAGRFAGSVIVALGIPAILLSPLMAVGTASTAFALVVCGALFYTFVLLPEAIKFDFRLDSDHLEQLKLLPLSPARIVIGQLTTPVVLASAFQAAMFVGVGLLRSVEPRMVVAAIALCLPLTLLFVALDNLAFLLFPHRPTQEGFEAFLRTILKFTAKSLLIVVFLLLVAAWGPVAAAIAELTASRTATVFGLGIIVGIAGLAVGSVACVVAAFRRFDVSLHGMA